MQHPGRRRELGHRVGDGIGDPRTAEIDRGAGDADGVRPAADPVATFEHDAFDARASERVRDGEARETGADDDDARRIAGRAFGDTSGPVVVGLRERAVTEPAGNPARRPRRSAGGGERGRLQEASSCRSPGSHRDGSGVRPGGAGILRTVGVLVDRPVQSLGNDAGLGSAGGGTERPVKRSYALVP